MKQNAISPEEIQELILKELGHRPTRYQIKATLHNKGIPVTDRDCRAIRKQLDIKHKKDVETFAVFLRNRLYLNSTRAGINDMARKRGIMLTRSELDRLYENSQKRQARHVGKKNKIRVTRLESEAEVISLIREMLGCDESTAYSFVLKAFLYSLAEYPIQIQDVILRSRDMTPSQLERLSNIFKLLNIRRPTL